MGYFRNTAIGISWVGGLRVSTRMITFIRVIILARLLTPLQFGVFGVASLVLTFLETITETGINVFLIQEKKEIKHYVNDAWAVSILRGTLISLFIIGLSPFISNFFNSPGAQRLLLLISIVPLIRGFINPAVVKFQKELLFDKDFFLNLSVFLFDSTIAVILAFVTRDASSFVWGLIAGALLEVAISFILVKPIPKISFNTDNIKRIFSRGKWVTLFVIFDYFAKNGDNIVVGKLLGVGLLGIYQMGYKISTLPISEVSDVANKVIFPIYSKIASDKVRLKKAFVKTIGVIALLVLMFGGTIFFLPKSLIVFILGKDWGGIADILKILVFYGILRAISGATASLFLALGKQNYFAAITFARVFGLAVTIVPLTIVFNLVGASISALLSVLIELPLMGYFLYLTLYKKSNES